MTLSVVLAEELRIQGAILGFSRYEYITFSGIVIPPSLASVIQSWVYPRFQHMKIKTFFRDSGTSPAPRTASGFRSRVLISYLVSVPPNFPPSIIYSLYSSHRLR